MRDDGKGGPEEELKWGILLCDLGFEYPCIPNAELENSQVFPPEFPVYLWCHPDRFEWRVRYGFFETNRIVFCQKWVDRERLLELIEEPDHTPILFHRYGQYLWCTNGTHRSVAAKITGRRILGLSREAQNEMGHSV